MSKRKPAGLAAVVLAGGRSKRFRSAKPKVLHEALGRPLLVWVLETLRELHRSERIARVRVVVPPGGDVEGALDGLRFPFPVNLAVQRNAAGTGDAVRVALKGWGDAEEVLVAAGDMPLISADSLLALVRGRRSAGAAAAVLTCEPDEPGVLGRVVRDGERVLEIVEAKDATSDQLAISEIGTSTYVFTREALKRSVRRLRKDNAAGEFYLTDTVGLLARAGDDVVGVGCDAVEGAGANTRSEFDTIRRVLRSRAMDALAEAGVTVIDTDTTYVDADVTVGADTVLLPNTLLEGTTRVGAGCEIGPNVRLVDTRVRDGAVVTFAVARGADIGEGAEVGPFASLREGTVLKRGAKAGTFVEMKAATIGEGTKVPHLSYMGDVRVGRDTNIGAGTITCNYNPFELAPDGSTKHETWIGDDVYISSDTMLVAPVRVGHRSQTGAGSVVTRNVGNDKLVYGVPATERGPAKQRAEGAKSARRAAKQPSRRRAGAGRAKKETGSSSRRTDRERKGQT